MPDFTVSASHLLGIDIAGAVINAALINQDAQIIARHTASLVEGDIIAQVVAATAKIRESVPELAAAGVSVPGLVNRQTNRVEVSHELPSLTAPDFYQHLCHALGVPVQLENDANAAAYGEYHYGCGRGCRNLFYATIGAGVGGAFILNGELWRGAAGYAGEFGHIIINHEDDTTLEMMASAENIVRRTRHRLAQDATSSLSPLGAMETFTAYDIARAAHRDGDDFACMMIERTGRFIGIAIAAVINLLNVERIAIGGTVADLAGATLIKAIRREAEQRSFNHNFAKTEIVPALLGVDAAMLGAALLARAALK